MLSLFFDYLNYNIIFRRRLLVLHAGNSVYYLIFWNVLRLYILELKLLWAIIAFHITFMKLEAIVFCYLQQFIPVDLKFSIFFSGLQIWEICSVLYFLTSFLTAVKISLFHFLSLTEFLSLNSLHVFMRFLYLLSSLFTVLNQNFRLAFFRVEFICAFPVLHQVYLLLDVLCVKFQRLQTFDKTVFLILITIVVR